MDTFLDIAVNPFGNWALRFVVLLGVPFALSLLFPSCKVCTNARCKGDH